MTDTNLVEGVVTLDGQPVAAATVTFQPVTEGQGVSATGITDENGVYKLTAVGTGAAGAKAQAGTLAGEYNVGVVKMSFDETLNEEEAEEKGEVEFGESGDDAVTHIVPEKYNNPKDSGIQVKVTDGANKIPIELTSG